MSTRAWNDGDPAGTDAAGTIDDSIRRLRTDIREREVQGGRKFTITAVGSAVENVDGRSCVGVEDGLGTDAGILTLAWDAAGTTARIRTYGSAHATKPSRLEIPGDLSDLSGNLQIKGGKAVAAFLRAVVSDPVPIGSTYLKRVIYKVPSFTGAPGRTLTKIRIIVGTKPGGADFQVTVRKLAAPADSIDRYNDTNSTALTTVTLTAASGNFATETTGLTHALATDDELVIKYGTVGTAPAVSDATFILQIE